MHSIGSISARLHSIDRPASSGTRAGSGSASRSVAMRWLPTTPAKCSNQNADIAVSTRPLLVMGSLRTTSNADMRSDVTMSRRSSPAS